MERRPLGRTGAELSIIGMGGIVVKEVEQAEADRIVSEAVGRGVNYFDVAPTYGNAEARLGPALEPYRDQVFLVGKTAERSEKESARDLDNTLRTLRTDYLDLYQLHGLASVEQVDAVFGPKGAITTLESARQVGKVRFLGFSAHSVDAALEALRRFPFDSVLFPINFACWFKGFGPQVLAAAKSHGAGRLTLKAMARTFWPDRGQRKWQNCWYEPLDRPDEAKLALRFTLSQDVTATVPPGEPSLFRMAMDLAERFRPITPPEEQRLRDMSRDFQPSVPQD